MRSRNLQGHNRDHGVDIAVTILRQMYERESFHGSIPDGLWVGLMRVLKDKYLSFVKVRGSCCKSEAHR